MTFRDAESARRSCANPNPVIDGRRANCNIASLGRPRPSPPRGTFYLFSPPKYTQGGSKQVVNNVNAENVFSTIEITNKFGEISFFGT